MDNKYTKFNNSLNMKSILEKQGYSFKKDMTSENGLSDDINQYYNTEMGDIFWKSRGLPEPTNDIDILRNDFEYFGLNEQDVVGVV